MKNIKNNPNANLAILRDPPLRELKKWLVFTNIFVKFVILFLIYKNCIVKLILFYDSNSMEHIWNCNKI
jgi:hypothetical protein